MRLLILLFTLCTLTALASTMVRVATPQSELEASTSYYLDLLQLVLDKTASDYGPAQLQFETVPDTGSLWKLLLNKKRIDVHWLTPTAEIDQQLRLIKAPILYGGLGLRGLIIKTSDLPYFQQIKSLSDLRRFTACQGESWPDVQVLQYAGLKVHRVQKFASMLDMLHKGRCDYFPRSLIEGDAELRHQAPSSQGLIFFTSVLLYYTMPVHFYVAPDDQALAARLTHGLTLLHQSGELLNFMRQHPVTAAVFEAGRYRQSILFKLHNPQLPEEHSQNQSDAWLEILQLKQKL